jgi:hypothetical protein
MNQKLTFFLISVVLLFSSCKKDKQLLLSEQNIMVAGSGTTFYSDEDYLRLLELTDTSVIYSITELKYSMNNLVVILNKYHDRAGAFPTLYNVITNVAYTTLINSPSPYATEGRAFMNEFAKHFIRNFNAYLKGNEIEPAWMNYFVRVAQNKNTILHLAMSGINAHITYDIPFVLKNINAQNEFEADFNEYTDFIAGAYPQAAAEMELQYNVQNAEKAFQLFEIGQAIDGVLGDGFTTHMIVDVLRTESWKRGMDLVYSRKTPEQMRGICFQSFKDRENLLQAADEANLLN